MPSRTNKSIVTGDSFQSCRQLCQLQEYYLKSHGKYYCCFTIGGDISSPVTYQVNIHLKDILVAFSPHFHSNWCFLVYFQVFLNTRKHICLELVAVNIFQNGCPSLVGQNYCKSVFSNVSRM
mmetsp:Transcript_33809/g.75612  ORF Transcript_33809/g.75612 Transcript_33809/m.75612 type:complete len:122 (-) Transcript_33809:90-455(-)